MGLKSQRQREERKGYIFQESDNESGFILKEDKSLGLKGQTDDTYTHTLKGDQDIKEKDKTLDVLRKAVNL